MSKNPVKQELERHIGRHVRLLRTERSLSLEDLAGITNVSLTHISNIERGKSSMTPFTQMKIAKGLNLAHPNELTNKAFDLVYSSYDF
ncbi:helix-turn-helix domain-containing protein [Bacillus sp. JCM 19034]|uniref:helix-turn-helix domain-containing protein n=1 Tax=Bacillus sp. JCM 19034 TaxID=1481928 RepID=UPI0007839985|nr:helix-turn-helix transcriptional regulator [Bacillus sp. JCM 19034]